ncbi:hypothetical protein [Azonexus hydrophilus]|uniref:hypothetical protein n=1 Tax=Azonexus hydrophilus TaxID=418702 RepID=UPI001964C11B|nr:hypothetical protein [Azonexus hydrophilus]
MTAEEDFGQENAAPEALVQVETVATPAVEQEKAQDAVAETAPDVLDEFQPLPLRRRLRELLSVPERDRSDAQWDEIIELEIQLAPGNRVAGHEASGGSGGHARHHAPRSNKPGGGGGQPQGGANAGGAGAQQKKHRPRSKNNRRPRPGGGKGGGEVAG